jgi:hypothetical protein
MEGYLCTRLTDDVPGTARVGSVDELKKQRNCVARAHRMTRMMASRIRGAPEASISRVLRRLAERVIKRSGRTAFSERVKRERPPMNMRAAEWFVK